jgi:hypothetical protein
MYHKNNNLKTLPQQQELCVCFSKKIFRQGQQKRERKKDSWPA